MYNHINIYDKRIPLENTGNIILNNEIKPNNNKIHMFDQI